MSYKNILLATTLFAHLLSLHAVPTQQPAGELTNTTSKPSHDNPYPEILKADKEFCLSIISDEKADINALSPSGKTALQLLILYFINNFSTERLIAHALKRGANANVQDEKGRTPLIFITAYTLCPKVFEEKQAMVDKTQTIENKNQEVVGTTDKNENTSEEISKIGRNPLHDRSVNLAVMELLLAFSADPTITDNDNISPLLLAVTTGDQEMVELFARYGLLEKIFQEITLEEIQIPEAENVISPEAKTTNL